MLGKTFRAEERMKVSAECPENSQQLKSPAACPLLALLLGMCWVPLYSAATPARSCGTRSLPLCLVCVFKQMHLIIGPGPSLSQLGLFGSVALRKHL